MAIRSNSPKNAHARVAKLSHDIKYLTGQNAPGPDLSHAEERLGFVLDVKAGGVPQGKQKEMRVDRAMTLFDKAKGVEYDESGDIQTPQIGTAFRGPDAAVQAHAERLEDLKEGIIKGLAGMRSSRGVFGKDTAPKIATKANTTRRPRAKRATVTTGYAQGTAEPGSFGYAWGYFNDPNIGIASKPETLSGYEGLGIASTAALLREEGKKRTPRLSFTQAKEMTKKEKQEAAAMPAELTEAEFRQRMRGYRDAAAPKAKPAPTPAEKGKETKGKNERAKAALEQRNAERRKQGKKPLKKLPKPTKTQQAEQQARAEDRRAAMQERLAARRASRPSTDESWARIVRESKN